MKLVSMKLSKAESKTSHDGMMPMEESDDPYPYGLELRLDTAALGKLGLEGLQVGDECVIEARGKVTMYREEESRSGKPDCTAEIQITDMAIEEASASRRERASNARLNENSRPTGGY